MAIKLGDRVRDTITGFEGIVFGDYRFLHGCRRLNVQGVKVDQDGNRTPTDHTFDEPQLEQIEAAPPKARAAGEVPG